MKKQFKSTVVVFLILAILLSACGSGDASPKTSNSSDVSTGSEPTQQSDYSPLTFNNYGREITITAEPQRVLALGPNCAEMLVALGLGDKIIGTSLRNHSRGPLPEYAAAFEKIPEINHSSATREAVISSGADFIYGIDWQFGSSGLDVSELLTYGITTYMNAATTIEQQYQEIRDIGKIFGIEAKAEAFIADQESRIAAVQKTIAGQTAPKVLVVDSFDAGVFTATGAGFANVLLNLAGGSNIFSDVKEKAFASVSYEEALAREPEVIVFFDYDVPPIEDKIAQIKSNDILSQLECVKNERFCEISLESVLAGDRIAYSVEVLAKGIYPDLFN
jgi:iron complex transport system substrate-binding protein